MYFAEKEGGIVMSWQTYANGRSIHTSAEALTLRICAILTFAL